MTLIEVVDVLSDSTRNTVSKYQRLEFITPRYTTNFSFHLRFPKLLDL